MRKEPRPLMEKEKLYARWIANNAGILKISGAKFIQQALKRCQDHQEQTKDCMSKMLLSIFFLGHVHESNFSPNDFLEIQMDGETVTFSPTLQSWGLSNTTEKTNYNKVPDKTPFSILLDMAVITLSNPDNEEDVKVFLLEFLKDVKLPILENRYQHLYYTLEATVFAVCYNKPAGPNDLVKKYYGASLCCRGEPEKGIMIYRSCLKVWHEYVSYAVLSFRQSDEQGRGIRIPNTVICKAFYRNQDNYEDRMPCKNCGDLFSLPDANTTTTTSPFGNCAETECLSKLLSNDKNVMTNVKISEDYTNRLLGLRGSAQIELDKLIEKLPFERQCIV